MQQTKNYKFNKPEMSDTFSTDPLNENAERMEAALDALATEDKKLGGRIAVLEGRKCVIGTYVGDTKASQTIELGFKPSLVYAQEFHCEQAGALAIPGLDSLLDGTEPGLKILDNGFQVFSGYYRSMNRAFSYIYIALG